MWQLSRQPSLRAKPSTTDLRWATLTIYQLPGLVKDDAPSCLSQQKRTAHELLAIKEGEDNKGEGLFEFSVSEFILADSAYSQDPRTLAAGGGFWRSSLN